MILQLYNNLRRSVKERLGPRTIEPSWWQRVSLWLATGIILIIAIFPFYVMAMTSLAPQRAIYNRPPQLLPTAYTFGHYLNILGISDPGIRGFFASLPGYTPVSSRTGYFDFIAYVVNSGLVATITSAAAVTVSTFGAYSFARLRYPGRRVVSRGVLFVYLFGGILLVVPLFRIVASIGMVDTLTALVVTHLVLTVPLALYMLGNYFRGLPAEIEEAALLDGYSLPEVIVKVTVPMSLPAIVAVFMYAFMISWNEYLFARIFLKSESKYTIPIGIEQMQYGFDQTWGPIMAASILTTIPVVVIFIYLEQYMLEGLTLGGVEK